jgi:hypothetical protein
MASVVYGRLAGCVGDSRCVDRLGDQENLRHIHHTRDCRDGVGATLHDDDPSLESLNGVGTGLEVSA